ncbi:MAG: outer membrane beta-barrel domain-containing protein [Nitrospinae bacterium]|nr:outer membrane beta-barrel domain-containing protein [Nitrospinota bacterium]
MKRTERIGALAIAMALMLPGVSQAEIKAKSWEISPFVGYNWFEADQNLKNQALVGGRLGYNFTRRFGLELAVEYLDTTLTDKDKTRSQKGQFGTPHESVNITFYHLDAVFHIRPDGAFNPFLLAGFGGVHYRPSISVDGVDMSAFNFGLGAKWALTENVALRGDLRDNIVSEVIQEAYHNYGATLGLTFSFGGNDDKGKRQVAAAPLKPVPVRRAPVIIPVAEPEAEKKVVAVAKQAEPEEEVVVLAFEDIHFDFDKATLTEEARAILRRNFQVLRENPKAHVRVAGYTSASGTDEYNQKLSERRATAVRTFLVEEGIAKPDRLTKIGYGEDHPAEYESAPGKIYSKAAMANMRVLFEIIVE